MASVKTVTSVATKIADQNSSRKGIILQSSANVYVSFTGDATVSSSTGFLLEDGVLVWFSDDEGRAKPAVYAITASGSATVKIEEVY